MDDEPATWVLVLDLGEAGSLVADGACRGRAGGGAGVGTDAGDAELEELSVLEGGGGGGGAGPMLQCQRDRVNA